MAEKVVSVRLQARVEGFTAGMRKAKDAVDGLTKADVPKAAAGYKDLANKAALAGTAIAVGLGVAVKRFADFDAAMSAVRANSGATGAELESLRQAAIKLGADSQFSATEAAQGINELAKAGVDSFSVLNGGLKGALDLAAAGQIGVAQAAETTASAMTQFGLAGKDAVHVADLLTNGANKAQGGVGDLGAALNQAGLVANAMGLSVEETTAGLTAFASAGLIGSDAGTSFKTMLQRLQAPIGAAADEMKRLGITAYDQNGDFIGLANVAGQLQEKLADLTPAQRNAAMATIFGADAVRAATILYNEGADGINEWTKAVSEQGAAAKQAATLTDNLNGDIERLGGAFDSVLIQSGSGANDALRSITQGLTGFVEVVGKVPGPLLLAGAGLTALALAVPKGLLAFKNYRATLDSVGLSFDKIAARGPRAAAGVNATTKAMKGLGIVATALAVGGALDQVFGSDANRPGPEGLTKDLLSAENAVDAFSERMKSFADEQSNWWSSNQVTNYGDALHDVFTPDVAQNIDNAAGSLLSAFGVENNSDIANATAALKDLDGVLTGLVGSGASQDAARLFDEFAAAAAEQGISVDQLKSKLPGYADALAGVSNAQLGAKGSGSALAAATDDAAQSAEDAKKAWDQLKDAIDGLGSPVAQQRAAERDFQAAIDDATASIKENGKTLDEHKEKGRQNQAALDAIRTATLAKVQADYALTGSTADATKAMEAGQKAFIKAATDAGMADDAALALSRQLGLIPEDVTILVNQSGAAAAGAAIDQAAHDRNSVIWVTRRYRETDFSGTFQGVGGRATGGAVCGPGSGTSDTAGLYRLSNGEHVLTAAEVAKMGGQSAVYAMRKAVMTGRFPGLASGGAVQYAPRTQVVTVSSGGPSTVTETTNAPVIVQSLVAADVDDFRRKATAEASWRRYGKSVL